jgi:hypothetical protein
MKIVSKRASSRNALKASQPDLFSWRSAQILNPAPIAARKLAQRYGITVPHALVVARLAGLGIETEARQ